MTDPRKIAEDIEAGGGATVEQRRTLARAYLALVSDLPVVIEAAERDAQLAEDEAFYERDEPGGDEKEAALLSERAKAIRAACERLRALGGG